MRIPLKDMPVSEDTNKNLLRYALNFSVGVHALSGASVCLCLSDVAGHSLHQLRIHFICYHHHVREKSVEV